MEGLRINSKTSDYLELVPKKLWRASTCFQGMMSLTYSRVYIHTESAYSRWSIVRLSVKSLT